MEVSGTGPNTASEREHAACGRIRILAVLAVAISVPPNGESCGSHTMIAGHLRERGLPVSPATAGRVLAQAKVRPAQGPRLATATALGANGLTAGPHAGTIAAQIAMGLPPAMDLGPSGPLPLRLRCS